MPHPCSTAVRACRGNWAFSETEWLCDDGAQRAQRRQWVLLFPLSLSICSLFYRTVTVQGEAGKHSALKNLSSQSMRNCATGFQPQEKERKKRNKERKTSTASIKQEWSSRHQGEPLRPCEAKGKNGCP